MQTPQSSFSKFRVLDKPSSFWGRYTRLVRDTVIPYQWEALNDRIAGAQPSHAIRNFRIAAGLETGEFVGMVFQDSDVGKWIEAVAYALESHPDSSLERFVDETVEIIAQAQMPDGYLNTYFTIKEPGRRWSNLWECHELYCAGHLLEGAVAYYRATGKRLFLDVMCRYVDLIARTFGTNPGQIRGYDGHEEIELALLRLFDVTGEQRHLELARFFLEERGRQPYFFESEWEALGHRSHWTKSEVGKPEPSYTQSHAPVRQQQNAVGHSVRAVYLYAAMADLAGRTNDSGLFDACESLWRNITQRQMYVTGAIGSTHCGEAFTFDFDLPNETAYAETCAAIGLIFFAKRMMEHGSCSNFAEVMELALYNAILASMSLDGKRFFYVNPLEVWPEASARNPDRHHVRAERQTWFGCACCPPNLARLIMSLGDYVCQFKGDVLWIHQYLSGTVPLPGANAALLVETEYPNDGRIRLQIQGAAPPGFCLALRIPKWCNSFSLTSKGCRVDCVADGDGYVQLTGPWQRDQELVLELALEVRVLEAHPEMRANAGKVCLQRGPLIYCLESADNGENLSALTIDLKSGFQTCPATDLPESTVKIIAEGWRRSVKDWDDLAYRQASTCCDRGDAVSLVAVPYHLWGNRGRGEMAVWIRG